MFATALIAQALLATATFARPSLSNRFERRRPSSHLSRPRQTEPYSTSSVTDAHVEYGDNWAGAVYNSATGTYKSVTGTFVVPTPKSPGSEDTYSASAWVGIDGDTCANAILQTGVDFTISGSTVTYDAWYEWYPDYSYDFVGFSISAGNTLRLNVTTTSTTSGSVSIENLTTGKTVTQPLTSTSALCEQDVEWIVEDYEYGGSLVPFANFGTVAFTDATATTGSGSVEPSGAIALDIEQDSILTSVSLSTSSVTINYV